MKHSKSALSLFSKIIDKGENRNSAKRPEKEKEKKEEKEKEKEKKEEKEKEKEKKESKRMVTMMVDSKDSDPPIEAAPIPAAKGIPSSFSFPLPPPHIFASSHSIFLSSCVSLRRLSGPSSEESSRGSSSTR